jgi:hypothetical protein
MAMKWEDVQNKSWNMKRQYAYENLNDGDRWDMVYGLLDSILSKLIENETLTLNDIREDDLVKLLHWKDIKTRYPKDGD